MAPNKKNNTTKKQGTTAATKSVRRLQVDNIDAEKKKFPTCEYIVGLSKDKTQFLVKFLENTVREWKDAEDIKRDYPYHVISYYEKYICYTSAKKSQIY